MLSNSNNNISVTSGQSLVYTSSGGSWDLTSLSLSNEMTDFFELVLAALGYDITYDIFKKMSQKERNQLIRDIKLKTIL